MNAFHANSLSQIHKQGKVENDRLPPPASLGTSAAVDSCRVFTHYNGPTDQLSGLCAGIAVLDPGATPHPPHEHPEEEFLIVAAGTGEIECAGITTQVGPGAMMYCAGGTLHGITNTGTTPMTFYWSKWLAKGA